jgi:CheY-specific phosphatase CheX
MATISHTEWLEATVASATELAKTSMGFTTSRVVGKWDELPEDMAGSWVALVGQGVGVQVGIASSLDGCYGLARAFLRLGDGDEIADDDVVDALGEMANVIAGGVKRRMAKLDPSTRLGLPIVVRGRVELGDRLAPAVAEVNMGKITAHLIVLCERG